MLRPGHAVALCVLALLTIGIVMVNSAGMQVGGNSPQSAESLFASKSTIYAGLAVLALLVCSLIPIRRLLPASLATDTPAIPEADLVKPGAFFLSPAWFEQVFREYVRLWPLWLGVLGLLLILAMVYMPGIQRPRNGSHRWITLYIPGVESIQPSEIAKWGLVVLIAWYGARSIHRMKSFWFGLLPGLAAAGLVAGFVVIEDLGTGALLGVAACIVLLAAGGRLWQLLILTPMPVAGAVLAVVTNPYRMHRIEAFLNPYVDPEGKGFHMIQSMAAVAGGGGYGRGLGHGLQKFGYLPEDTTDFLFAIVCEELGIAGAALVLSLFVGLIWSIWLVVRSERIPVLKLFCLGVLSTIGVQALINLVVVTGLGPTKGIALPLLSSGGTGWILTAAALGLVISIDRAQAREGARLFRGSTSDDASGVNLHSTPAMMMATVAGAMAATPTFAQPERNDSPERIVDVTPAPEAQTIAESAPAVEPELSSLPAEAEVSAADDLDDETDVASSADDADEDESDDAVFVSDAQLVEPVATEAAAAATETSEIADTTETTEPVASIEPDPTPQPAARIPAVPPVVAPGETGFLFAIHNEPAPEIKPEPAAPQEPRPLVVVTSMAKAWAEQRRAASLAREAEASEANPSNPIDGGSQA